MNTHTFCFNPHKKIIGVCKWEVGSGKSTEKAEDTQYHQVMNFCIFSLVKFFQVYIIWASVRENLSLVVCKQEKCRSACAFVQSDLRLCYSFIGKYHI